MWLMAFPPPLVHSISMAPLPIYSSFDVCCFDLCPRTNRGGITDHTLIQAVSDWLVSLLQLAHAQTQSGRFTSACNILKRETK